MKRMRRIIVLCLGIVLAVGGAVAFLWPSTPQLYRMTILPALSGQDLAPRALNDRGQVVGLMQTGKTGWRLFVWDRASGLQNLGPALGGDCDINEQGQIAATRLDPNGVTRACVVDPNGAVRFLGSLGGLESHARAINNRGQVVGRSLFATLGSRIQRGHAFIWDAASGMRDLGAVDGQVSRAAAISEAGQVFGFYEQRQVAGMRWQPCYWDPADAYLAAGVETPGRDYFDMNGNAWVLGKHVLENDGPHVVLWHEQHGIKKLFPYDRDIDVLNPSTWLINDANQVVYTEEQRGRWERFSTKLFPPRHGAYLWDPNRGHISLSRCLPKQTQQFEVCDLSNKGCIVGIAHLKDGQTRLPILLEPISERWTD